MPLRKSRTPSPAAGDGRSNTKLMASAIAAANRLSRSTIKKNKGLSNPNPNSHLPADSLKTADIHRPSSSEKRNDHGKGVVVAAPNKPAHQIYREDPTLKSSDFSSLKEKDVDFEGNKESAIDAETFKDKEEEFVPNPNSFVKGSSSSALVIFNGGTQQNPNCMHDEGLSPHPQPAAAVGSKGTNFQPRGKGTDYKGSSQVPANWQKGDAGKLKPDKTFAQAASRNYPKPPDVIASGLLAIPSVKEGTFVSFTIPDAIYKEQLHAFRFAIIGRLMLKKGEAPRLTLELQEELTACLKPVDKWQLINLGKGYFTLKFSCEEDLKKISRFSSYKLSSGVMFLREWKRGFDPYKEQSSVAQVWVRAYHLPAELWHPEVLAAVFREIGNLVKFDSFFF